MNIKKVQYLNIEGKLKKVLKIEGNKIFYTEDKFVPILEIKEELPILSKEEYEAYPSDYRAVWSKKDTPQLVGKRTVMIYPCKLLVEDFNFKIV